MLMKQWRLIDTIWIVATVIICGSFVLVKHLGEERTITLEEPLEALLQPIEEQVEAAAPVTTTTTTSQVASLPVQPVQQGSAAGFDAKMKEYGLVDIQSLDPNIMVELKYSTKDNFVGEDMYGSLERAYLVPSFAEKVARAQQILQERHPGYALLVYDAARPISVQRRMRKIVEGTEWEDFVADGTKGGRHNFGVAVDLTIIDDYGMPLDMGAGFDDFAEAAAVKGTPDNSDPATRSIDVYRAFARDMQSRGILTQEQTNNRILLLEVMCEAGLVPYRLEWWHFELIESIEVTREKYALLDF